LKAKSGWYQNANGTDEYGFSALPGGIISNYHEYAGRRGYWWTATETGSSAYNIYIYYDYDYVYDDYYPKSYGQSVRCVMDE
jgi:uncharacterized protein (TIGR02145 family)